LVIGYWLLVIGYWLLVIEPQGNTSQLHPFTWLLAIGYWLLVIGYWLLVIELHAHQSPRQHLPFSKSDE